MHEYGVHRWGYWAFDMGHRQTRRNEATSFNIVDMKHEVG